MQGKKRVDVHSHYFPPAYEELLTRHGLSRLDGAPRPRWNEEIQLEYMEKLQIALAVLSISSPHLHMGDAGEAVEIARASNEYGAALSRRCPGKFAIMASLPLPEIEASIREIRYCRDTLGTAGFALPTHALGVYLGSPELEPVMEELNRCKVPVVVHPTQPAARSLHVNEQIPAAILEYFFETTRAVTNMLLQGTIRKYPNIQFVIPHAGAFLPILSDRLATLAGALRLDGGLDVTGDLSKLYYDLAGVSMPKQLAVLRMVTDDSHLLYGSDAPFTPLPLCEKLSEAMDAALSGEQAELI